MKLALAAATTATAYLLAALFGVATLYNEADRARVTVE